MRTLIEGDRGAQSLSRVGMEDINVSLFSTRRRILGAILACIVAGMVACTTPDAVRQFTAAAAQGAAQFPPLVRDMKDSCIRKQLADRPLNEVADLSDQTADACKEFSDLEPKLLGALGVLTQYLNALNQLASDSAVTYDKEIDDLASGVQSVGNFKEPQVKAVKGLAKFLVDAAASGYQRKKLGTAIKAADADVATLTSAFALIATDYDRILRNEEESVKTRYREAARRDGTVLTLLHVQERWGQDLATLSAKRRAAKDYQQILKKIADGHKQLAAQVDHWDAQQLIQILKPYASTIQTLLADFKAAYSSQSTQ